MLDIRQPFEQITEPFAIHLASGLLTVDQLSELFATAPQAGYERAEVLDASHDKQYAMNLLYLQKHNELTPSAAELSPVWAKLVEALRADDFIEWLEAGSGQKLRHLPTDIAVYTYTDGDYISVHKDKPYKAITAILYLNPEWPADGGGDYEVRVSPDPTVGPVRSIPPTGGQLLAFPPTDDSWHSVSPTSTNGEVTRLTVQLEFWLVEDPRRRYQEDTQQQESARV